MPYLSWSTEGFLRTELLSRKDDIHEHEAELNSVEEHSELYQRHVSHSPVSLDQYYYVGLQAGELQERNSDQVMSRYLKRSATLEHNSGGSNGNLNTTPENARTSMSSGSHEQAQITQPNDRSEKQEARHAGGRSKEGLGVLRTEGSQGIPSNDRTATDISESIASQILVINQLWLWVLDDNTIITSSTKNDTKVQETFLHQVLLRIQAQKTASESLLGQIVEIIVETATTSFYDINIRLDATGKAKRSPMDIFRESLQTVRNEETNLFDKFERSLEEDKTGQQSNSAARQNLGSPQTDQNPVKKPTITRLGEWWESLKENELENRYQNIQNETRLLREIKDILDELRILKELANDQEHVNGLWKKVVDVETNRRYTIKETKDDIDNMIQEAKSVEDAINTLLDLKQKQATILEARATRQQSDTVMVFTVVTIVFTWNGLGGWSRRPVKSDSREQQDVAIKANHFKYLLPSAWGKQENEANKSVEGNSCEPHQIAPGQFRVQDESLQEDGQMSKMSPDNDKRV
ncbi:hypothetical protein N7493_001407 [Penicillium malachiteum]|uniref:Uncharacterized protein n=1 Tax=Penicillium malachiteum TaxID=1324776 RepID=A0AAD6HUP9_9EURO|nr:hypothetical protein N7493_001407 [Penicillium malachiteum]